MCNSSAEIRMPFYANSVSYIEIPHFSTLSLALSHPKNQSKLELIFSNFLATSKYFKINTTEILDAYLWYVCITL